MSIDTLFSILILIFSVIVHEVAHGYAALALGDPTAKYEGRLTLNPIKHIDPFGSVVLPLLLALVPGSPIFGWAKPVPYNPYNLRNKRWGELLVAIAGPASNIAIALIFGVVLRIFGWSLPASFVGIASLVVFINLILAVFNLVPIPPLDGCKVLFAFLPPSMSGLRDTLERYGFFLALIFIFFLWQYVSPLVLVLFRLFVGN